MIAVRKIDFGIASRTDMPTERAGALCTVSLIDRRTGATPSRNGRRMVVVTGDPQSAVAELLEGRNPALWDTRIEPFLSRGR